MARILVQKINVEPRYSKRIKHGRWGNKRIRRRRSSSSISALWLIVKTPDDSSPLMYISCYSLYLQINLHRYIRACLFISVILGLNLHFFLNILPSNTLHPDAAAMIILFSILLWLKRSVDWSKIVIRKFSAISNEQIDQILWEISK